MLNHMRIVLIVFIQCFIGLLSFAQQNTINSKSFVLGLVDEMQSRILNEKRILNIYLPPGYHSSDTSSYPLIYLLDGSADEDFIHVAGLVQFNNLSWVNRVPPSILVGIANTDRRRDFTHSTTVAADQKRSPTAGQSDKFIEFIEKELQPYINQKYRVRADKTIIGQSLGGLLATEILLKRPALFNRYIIISPSLWWNNGSLLKQAPQLISNIHEPASIYIAVGKEGLAPTEIPHVMEVEANCWQMR
jgi:predicted alpha/beta superfamily hydrolase